MSITIRSITTGQNDGTTATVSATTPTGVNQAQSGDVMLIFHGNDFYTTAAMPTPTVSPGSPTVTLVTNGTADGGTNLGHIKTYTAVVNTGGAQTVSVTETGTHDEEKSLFVLVLAGVDTVTGPIDTAANTSGASATSQPAPTVSPTSSNALLVCVVHSGGGSATTSYTAPGSMSNETEIHVGGLSAALATEQLSASGSTGTRTFTAAGAIPWSAVSVAVLTGSAAAPDPTGGYQPLNPVPPHLLFRLAARDQAMWLGNPPAGSLFTQALSGTVTSAGALSRQANKALAGAVTSAGALAKAVTKPGLAGTVTSSGSLVRLAQKALAGTVTSSGVLTTVKVVLRSFAGALTPSGALVKQVNKALGGAATPAGALSRQAGKALAGAIGPAGALTNKTLKALAGSLTPTGVLTTIKVVLRSFAGALTSSGALTRQPNKALAGTVTPSATVKRAVGKTVAAVVGPVGSLAKLVARPFAGRLTPSGVATIVKGLFGLPGTITTSTRSGGQNPATSSAHIETSTSGGDE